MGYGWRKRLWSLKFTDLFCFLISEFKEEEEEIWKDLQIQVTFLSTIKDASVMICPTTLMWVEELEFQPGYTKVVFDHHSTPEVMIFGHRWYLTRTMWKCNGFWKYFFESSISSSLRTFSLTSTYVNWNDEGYRAMCSCSVRVGIYLICFKRAWRNRLMH